MAIVIDSAIGGANANSYLSLVSANTIAETIPHMKDWLFDPDLNRPQLLVHATRLLDRYFIPAGELNSETQALKWPRKHVIDFRTGRLLSHEVIPTFVEMATVEWAWALRDAPDPSEVVGHGLKRLETPSYRMEFNGVPQEVVPRVVNSLMAPYCMTMASPFHRVVRV